MYYKLRYFGCSIRWKIGFLGSDFIKGPNRFIKVFIGFRYWRFKIYKFGIKGINKISPIRGVSIDLFPNWNETGKSAGYLYNLIFIDYINYSLDTGIYDRQNKGRTKMDQTGSISSGETRCNRVNCMYYIIKHVLVWKKINLYLALHLSVFSFHVQNRFSCISKWYRFVIHQNLISQFRKCF